jgi:hypothetical protein
MFKKIVLIAFVAVSFGSSILASATPASAMTNGLQWIEIGSYQDGANDDDGHDWNWLF